MYNLLTVIVMMSIPLVSGEGETDQFIVTLEALNYEYVSSEAAGVAKKLGEFMVAPFEELGALLEEIKSQNCASESLNNFVEAAAAAKNSKCTITIPKDAEGQVNSVVDSCAFSVSVYDLKTVLKEVSNIQKKIKALDDKLKVTSKEEDRKKTVNELNNVFSVQVADILKKILFLDIRAAMDKCVKESIGGLITELDSSTKKIKDCLAKSK